LWQIPAVMRVVTVVSVVLGLQKAVALIVAKAIPKGVSDIREFTLCQTHETN